MQTITDFMEQDHDRLDGLFKKFQSTKDKNLSEAKGYFHEFKMGLQRHIVWEEEILFPLFEKATGMYDHGPTAVMRTEHHTIKDYLRQIHEAVAQGRTPATNVGEELVDVLSMHNQKEEGILYPWIDNTISDKEVIFEQMRALPPERYNACCETPKRK